MLQAQLPSAATLVWPIHTELVNGLLCVPDLLIDEFLHEVVKQPIKDRIECARRGIA